MVRAEAGVTLRALHTWLLARQRELSFCPEIGDATVGGLVTTMCKDSSIKGPGYLGALVEELTYVDHEGNARARPAAPRMRSPWARSRVKSCLPAAPELNKQLFDAAYTRAPHWLQQAQGCFNGGAVAAALPRCFSVQSGLRAARVSE